MPNTNELAWGMHNDMNCRCCYGARAIYDTRGNIDLLCDRQAYEGDQKDWKKMSRWLDKKAIKAMRKYFLKNDIPTSSEHEWRMDDGDFHIMANPRGSYGYMYIVAWMDKQTETKEAENE